MNGIWPALVTPMSADGAVDEVSFVRLLAHVRAMGLAGALIAGTTGEGPSLSAVEKRDLVRRARSAMPELELILAIATPSLSEAIWLSEQARKAGAVAVLVMPPAFFREVDDAAIAEWYEALFRETLIPTMVYNFPNRVGRSFSPELLGRLAKHERFGGVKDSSGEVANLVAFREVVPERCHLMVGDERMMLDAKAAGWNGSLCGSGNVIGHWLQTAWEEPIKFDFVLPMVEMMRQPRAIARAKSVLYRENILESAAVRLPLHPEELSEEEFARLWPYLLT